MSSIDEALQQAIENQDVEAAEAVLRRGAAANGVDSDTGQPFVDIVFARDNERLLRLLHAYGADVTAVGPRGETLLHRAAYAMDSHPLVAALIELGVDVDAADGDGWTALHHASAHGYAATVRRLLTAGADTRLRTPNGLSAHDLATRNDQRDVMALLTGL